MPMMYNPRRWYWFVGNDCTKVFSSEDGGYVSIENKKYESWRVANFPTIIASEQELRTVLLDQAEDVAPTIPLHSAE